MMLTEKRSKKTNFLSIIRLQSRNEKLLLIGIKKWLIESRKQIIKDVNSFFKAADFVNWASIEENGRNILNPVILNIYTSGKKQARRILELRGAFDITSIETVEASRKICSKLVTGITNETRIAITEQITAGLAEGKSNTVIARELRPLVGLNNRQANAVVNLRRELEGKGLTQADINRRISAYSNRSLIQRTNTIARTETARAQHAGYIEQLTKENVARVEYSAFPGCCDECTELDGKEYSITEGQNLIPLHPNCRCAVLPVVNF